MKKGISVILKYGTLWSTYGLIASVLLQIFARFFLPSAPAWTEETSRLFFIYAIGFSAGLAFQNKDYIHLDWFYQKFSRKTQLIVRMGIVSLSFTLFVIIAFYSIEFVVLGYQEVSPGMNIRMSFAFSSLFILSASLSYFIGRELLEEIKALKP